MLWGVGAGGGPGRLSGGAKGGQPISEQCYILAHGAGVPDTHVYARIRGHVWSVDTVRGLYTPRTHQGVP